MALSDPVYLALVDDDTMRATISKGRPGTAMSAFAQKEGGMLTDQQIDAIIHGIRLRWAKPGALAGISAPPYAASAPGIAAQGQAAYGTFCATESMTKADPRQAP
jgi:cytochrome c oxidase cbb3-type subunit 3/ubiquinol-cytochrome c reductase cytochrome c subunit